MKTSQRGIDLIKQWEGLRLEAYKPIPEDPWTIGFGHTKDVQENDVIDYKQAEQFLREDLEVYEKCVESYCEVLLNQNEFDALVSFAFNLGCGNLKKSTLLKLLNAGNRDAAAKQFPRWNRAAGNVLAGLTKRRVAERSLFLT